MISHVKALFAGSRRASGQGGSIARTSAASAAPSTVLPVGSGAPAARLSSRTRLVFAALATTVLLLVVLVSQVAQAKDLLGWFGNPTGSSTAAGEFNQPRDIGVNRSGAGPANQGDIYVADSNNNRIQRFDSEGNWISAWGMDVHGINEQQQVFVDALGGTYTLEFEGETTEPIPENANGNELEPFLEELAAIGPGNVDGTGSANGTKTVTFINELGGTDLPLMVGDESELEGLTASVEVTPLTDGEGGNFSGYEVCTEAPLCKAGVPAGFNGTPPSNESQTVHFGGFSTGDTFTLTCPNGETTEGIVWSSSAETVRNNMQAGLEAKCGAGNFSLTSGPLNPVVHYEGAFAETDIPQMTCTKTSGGGTCEITTEIDGNPRTPGTADGNGAMDNPESVAVDNDTGNVYVSDRDNKRVNEYDGVGTFIRSFGWDVVESGPGNTGTEHEICEQEEGDVCKEGIAGEGIGQIGSGTLSEAWGIAVSAPDGEAASGTVFLADTSNERVNTYALDGTSPSSFGSEAVFASNQPRKVAVDSRGIVYASNSPDFVERFDFENAHGGGEVFLDPLTELQIETQTVRFQSVTNGDEFTLTCPNGETTDPFAWDTNNIILGENMEAALEATCGPAFFTQGPSQERTVYFIGNFEGVNVPQMTCTRVSGNGLCEISAESNGVPGALLPGTDATATDGLAVDPDLDEGGPEEDILYILRDPSGTATGNTRILQFGPVNDAGQIAPPTDDDAQHAGTAGFATTGGFGLDPLAGNLYVSATSGLSGIPSGHRVYIINDPSLESVAEITSITDIGQKSAKISAILNPKISPTIPNPPGSDAQLEYKLTTESQWTKYGPEIDIGSGDSDTNATTTLGGLVPNREYEVRYSVSTDYGGLAFGAPDTFVTLPAAPAIEGFFASNVQATSADLNAIINPLGQDTKYRFEYGTTPDYGNVAPVPDGEITASPNPQKVTVHIEGLEGVTYHFRVIAENEAGKTTTANQTFNFYPPSCPNSHLRQQTNSGHLPDCRAYELVSPPNAGSTILVYEGPWSPTATSPSRFGYTGLLGLLPDTGEPMGVFGDSYVATRTNSGWVTRYVGLRGSEGALAGGPPNVGQGPAGAFVNEDMSQLLDWNNGTQGYVCCGELGSYAPYLWDYTGEFIRRLPTNIHEVPAGLTDASEGGFAGDVEPSRNFDHYFFSSHNVPFTPDGQVAGSGVVGSAYDNDVKAETVSLISRTPSGEHIPSDAGGPNEYIEFPGAPTRAVSRDGSHIVMSTAAPGNLTHLYMRVNGAITYDLSIGQDGLNHPAKFEGMTPDGETVYLTSTEQLTPDDEDESKDLYMWTEKPTPTLTRISKGTEGTGNEDACNAAWIAGCGAEVVDIETHISGFGGGKIFPTDNAIAANTGDVYFYSPELFDSGQGTFGQRNLYVYRDGKPQYVATLLDGRFINRIQASPDNEHAAFVTDERLTSYDNEGFLEMYHYSPATGEIVCVSCKPDGSPPKSDVEASQNGLFMTNDGRTFFSTKDPLVERDINGLWDTYEFVENRPQLISTGTAERDEGRLGHVGLIGVSADGLDVYFSTVDTMVGQDKNGPFYKFYNARTNGGFPFEPPAPGCVAADECHGPDSEAPEPFPSGTNVPLGSGGNARFDSCAGLARRAKRLSSRAKALSRRAKRSSGNGSARLRRQARVLVKRARRTSGKAKRCRKARASANRGARR